MPIPPEVLKKAKEQLAEAKKRLPVLLKDLDDARRAGIDVKELQKNADDLRLRITQFESVYGS